MNTIQRYRAKKGNYLYFILLSVVVPILYIWLLSINFSELVPFSYVSFIPFVFLSWIYCSTAYTIKDQKIFYRAAFVQGSFNISDVTEVRIGKRPMTGNRPALASQGMLLIYEGSKEVFLAPAQPKKFLKNLKKINKNIAVVRSDWSRI